MVRVIKICSLSGPHLHPAHVDFDQLLAALLRRQLNDVDPLFQPPPQRLVQIPRHVGRRQHDHPPLRLARAVTLVAAAAAAAAARTLVATAAATLAATQYSRNCDPDLTCRVESVSHSITCVPYKKTMMMNVLCRRKIENNWSFVLHEAPFFSVSAASSAGAAPLLYTFSFLRRPPPCRPPASAPREGCREGCRREVRGAD